MDWNWFFSSLAQSTAAIVGIFGAFIFTKIIGNEAEYHRKRNRLRELMNRAARLEDEVGNRHFAWYNRQVGIDEGDDLTRLLENDKILTPEEYLEELNFSPYVPVENVLAMITKRVESEVKARRNPRPAGHIAPFGIGIGPDISRLQIRASLRTKIESEREIIERLRVEVDDHIRVAKGFLGEISDNPESSSTISISIGCSLLLFLVGVIYPLSFMPTAIGEQPVLSFSVSVFLDVLFSLRGFLLFLVTIVFCGVMAGFFMLNRNLKYSPGDLKELERIISIDSYSSYFTIQDRNTQWWSSRSKTKSHVA